MYISMINYLKLNYKIYLILFLIILSSNNVYSQIQKVTGVVKDKNSKQGLYSAIVSIKGTSTGTNTDLDGKFSLNVDLSSSQTLVISYLGYNKVEVQVSQSKTYIEVFLSENVVTSKEVTVQSSRLTEKQKEAPLTVESMDLISIKQTSASNFYEGLGQLKGVDVNSASIGFKVINTRGFNSTSPVRSLQLIDGVDNQSPGLNFSLGNFLGASELDVQKVDLIVGASSAFYGPNAFNGVISMTTRSPFMSPGLSVMTKVGERGLFEFATRYAKVYKNKLGEDKFAYKLNLYYMQANDWKAENYSATEQSPSDERNPGGYDAVNIYGDEYDNDNDDSGLPRFLPGLNIRYRTGYREKDLVDYNTNNTKGSAGLFYKINPKTELNYTWGFGSGTTVYQGDNRYSLKDIFFMQNKIELKKEDKYFIRAYSTYENSGNSYDAVFTALLLQQKTKSGTEWAGYYRNNWSANGKKYFDDVLANDPNAPKPPSPGDPEYSSKFKAYQAAIYPYLYANYYDSLVSYHSIARTYADTVKQSNITFPSLVPGTDAYQAAFDTIVSRSAFKEGGSRFFDRSSLYNVQGEYKFTPSISDIIIGGSYRLYTPKSNGTIFSDTSGTKITNQEFGVYLGLERKFFEEKLKVNFATRVDKNQNFKPVVSPAASLVYTYKNNHVFRLSFSSALRNPTLADQYLYYNVGRAILLGNLNGVDSLVTIESLGKTLNSQSPDSLEYFNIDPIKPEQVRSIELGYRATLFNKLFLDASYYYSVYSNFIGYRLGVDLDYFTNPFFSIYDVQVYRVAANTKDVVTTQGFSIGLSYFFNNFYALTGNYSWNELDKRNSKDPIIPAFNTPRNKFNIGFSGRDIDRYFGPIPVKNWSFSVNYKWVEGFQYEGSPQFTGFVDSYGMLDAQVSKNIPSILCTFKLGASNLLDNKVYQVYGGPLIGRMAYFSVLFDLSKK